LQHERESPTSAGRRRVRAGLLLTFDHLEATPSAASAAC